MPPKRKLNKKLRSVRDFARKEWPLTTGAALVTGALNQPGVSGQIGAQPSPNPRIDAFT